MTVVLADDDRGVLNLLGYGLPVIFDETRGSLPFAFCCALAYVESTCDPYAFNYYADNPKTGKREIHASRWEPGTPLPDGGDGRPNAWAAGLLQIIRPYPRGLRLEDRFDARKECERIFPELRTYRARAEKHGLSGRDLDAATYFAHNQGPARLNSGLPNAPGGIEQVIMHSGLDAPTARRAYIVALKCASYVPAFEALEPRIRSGELSGICAPPEVPEVREEAVPAPAEEQDSNGTSVES